MKFKPIVMQRDDAHHVRHPNLAAAEKEAERLARLLPGKDFCVYVPMVIVSAPPPPLKRTEVRTFAEEEDDIPF